MWNNRLVSSINLLGLSLGIACCLLLVMYVKHEYAFDQFLEDGDRIHRVLLQETGANGRKIALSGKTAFEDLKANYSSLEDVLRIRNFSYEMSPSDDREKKVNVNFLFAGDNFFEFFKFPILSGDSQKALEDPSSIVITASTALKLFNRTDVVGETLSIDATAYFTFKKDLVITAVAQDIDNSHIEFEAIIPWSMTEPGGRIVADALFSRSLFNYAKTTPGADPEQTVRQINQRLTETDPNADYEYYFQPVREAYLDSNDIRFSSFRTGNAQMVKTLLIVAIIILLIASINYVNLQTARESKRSLEVAVKRVLGAERRGLITQFMLESFLLTLFASCLAVLFMDLSLPAFNELTGNDFTIQKLIDLGLVNFVFIIFVLTSLLSGVYPAFVLSSFKPSSALRGGRSSKGRNKTLRSGLMLLQLGVSIILIAITFIIYQQTNFIHKKELGFNKDQVITIGIMGKDIERSMESFREEVDLLPNVMATSLSTDVLGPGITNNSGAVYPKLDAERKTSTTVFGVDHSFVNTYQLEVIIGRDFRRELASDSNAVIVNQALVSALNLEDPLGQDIVLYRPDGPTYKIVGVVKDFHFQKLHRGIAPVAIRIAKWNIWQMSVRMSAEDMAGTIDLIGSKWRQFEQETQFEYEFVNDQFARFYADEQRMLKSITFFSVISIVLTMLGLFAMTVFSIEQKLKEIGVRKVLGAQVRNIVMVIFNDILKVLVVSIVISIPLIVYFGNSWLERFAYRIQVGAIPMVLAVALTLIVLLSIVSALALKAAKVNPIKILRTE